MRTNSVYRRKGSGLPAGDSTSNLSAATRNAPNIRGRGKSGERCMAAFPSTKDGSLVWACPALRAKRSGVGCCGCETALPAYWNAREGYEIVQFSDCDSTAFKDAQMSHCMDSQPEQWPQVSVCKCDKSVVLRLVQFTVREIRYASSSAGDRATAEAAVISNWRLWLVGGAADRARRRWVSRDCKPLRWAVSVANRSSALI
ncbi:hypothetical protein FB567DRAFT_545382 [Paraphoma chrysanthemicola]|uniref:Uncharacterized protein n=1 Tax=Paraphoma chrysanthemicola TaxID=798071 RepID=A0A8K0RFE2_9PLEO|nr:hypothetical protein FB567DRAFT_545382 [Paraphoma chrysanthemicola]